MAATHVVNRYLWSLLSDNLGDDWKLVPNFGYPIVPAQQQPEVTESGLPYITYIYTDADSHYVFPFQTQTLTYQFFHSRTNVISPVLKLIKDKLGRWDESARDVNDWLRTADVPELYRRFNFKSIRVLGTTSAQPAGEEGGDYDGMAVLELKFIEFD